MADIWIYKPDGTVQCQEGGEITLEAMKQSLLEVIGADNIIRDLKCRSPNHTIDVCGAPSGMVNAYQITEAGLVLLFSGVAGPLGFTVWPGLAALEAASDPSTGPVVPWPLDNGTRQMSDRPPVPWPWISLDRPVPWPWSVLGKLDLQTEEGARGLSNVLGYMNSVGSQPTTLTEIIGRKCRIIKSGEPYTFDWVVDRVNIVVDQNERIERIWFH